MPKVVKEPLATIYERLRKRKKLIIATAAIAVALLAFGISLKDLILLPALFFAAAFSQYYRKEIRIPPSFELVSITTVVVGMTHGPLAGAVFGGVAGLAAEILSGAMDAFSLSYIPGRIIMGAIAGFFPAASALQLGMILVLVYNAIAQSLYLLQGDPEAKIKTAAFVFFNVGINFILFSLLGEFLVGLLR